MEYNSKSAQMIRHLGGKIVWDAERGWYRGSFPIYYTVGKNMTGYMPESDVYHCANEAEAKMVMIDWLTSAAESFYDILAMPEEYGLDAHDGMEVNRILSSFDEEIHYLENIEVRNGWSVIMPSSLSRYDLGISYWINVSDGTEPMPEDEY